MHIFQFKALGVCPTLANPRPPPLSHARRGEPLFYKPEGFVPPSVLLWETVFPKGHGIRYAPHSPTSSKSLGFRATRYEIALRNSVSSYFLRSTPLGRALKSSSKSPCVRSEIERGKHEHAKLEATGWMASHICVVRPWPPKEPKAETNTNKSRKYEHKRS